MTPKKTPSKTLKEILDPPLFDIDEMLSIESDVISTLNLNTGDRPSNHYFKQEVAIYLYNEWKKDNNDTRILKYCFPIIQFIMFKPQHQKRYISKFRQIDVFTQLSLIILENLPKFKTTIIKHDKKTGKKTVVVAKFYTFITFLVDKRIITIFSNYDKEKKRNENVFQLEENYDTLCSNDAVEEMISFNIFLERMHTISSGSLKVIISKLQYLLTDSSNYNIADRAMLVRHLSKLTGKPDILITHTLNMLVDRYTHAVLD